MQKIGIIIIIEISGKLKSYRTVCRVAQMPPNLAKCSRISTGFEQAMGSSFSRFSRFQGSAGNRVYDAAVELGYLTALGPLDSVGRSRSQPFFPACFPLLWDGFRWKHSRMFPFVGFTKSGRGNIEDREQSSGAYRLSHRPYPVGPPPQGNV